MSEYKRRFNILIIGISGSGKTTFMQAFNDYINYVEFKDRNSNKINFGYSVTRNIKFHEAYNLISPQDTFVIMDTPGLGDAANG
jgi:septin family protein